MKEKYPLLQVRIDSIDGATRTLVQNDADAANRTLMELHPALLFTQDRITISDNDTKLTVIPPLVSRIDMVTDQLSVWDFPFVLGAPLEVTEAEFTEGVRYLESGDGPEPKGETPVFLGLEMLDGQRIYLRMQVVAGLPRARLERVYSLLKERRLVFGLRAGGIGILNLSNLVRFEVHPEPPRATATASARYHLNERKQKWDGRGTVHWGSHRIARSIHSDYRNHAVVDQEEPE